MDRSDGVGELAAALAKAQGAMDAARKDANNPFFNSKYANMASIVAAAREPLAANGLACTQGAEVLDDGRVQVTTVLMHSSGQWVSSSLAMKPTQATPQGIGSAITYARRYGYQSMVGLATDADDDGNEASRPEQPREQAPKGVLQPNGQQAPPPRQDAPLLPDDPALMVKWFRTTVAAWKPIEWADDVKKRNAQKLAIALKQGGMGDDAREQVYTLFTGVAHASQMDPREMILFNHNASTQGVAKMLSLLDWMATTQDADTGF